MKPEKPLGVKNYGSIAHLPGSKLGEHDSYIHEGQARIITERFRDRHDFLYVTEKYDGTNVGVAKINGKIIAIQRKGYDCKSSPYYPHVVFDEYVDKNKKMFDMVLGEGERIVGEWLYEASGIHYKIKGDPFVTFDFFTADNNRLSYKDFMEEKANNITAQPARLIHYGEPKKPEDLLNDLNIFRFLVRSIDGQGPEGMVFRIERKGVFDFMAKWVRSDFQAGKYLPGVGLPKDSEGIKNEIDY